MNAFSQDIALTCITDVPASRAAALVAPRKQDVAARHAARAVLFQDCLETALTGLVFLGCLLFAAAALRLSIAPCPLRHWGVLSLYGTAATLAGCTLAAIGKQLLQFTKSFG